MSSFSDNESEMSRHCLLDDAEVEALLSGCAPADFGGVADFVEAVGHLTFEPAPVPSKALAVVLAEGIRHDERAVPRQVSAPARGVTAVEGAETTRWRRRRTARVVTANAAGLSLVAKVALGISAAAASTAGAAAGVLPAPAQTFVTRAVETITPFQMPGPTKPTSLHEPAEGVSDPLNTAITTPPASGAGSDGTEEPESSAAENAPAAPALPVVAAAPTSPTASPPAPLAPPVTQPPRATPPAEEPPAAEPPPEEPPAEEPPIEEPPPTTTPEDPPTTTTPEDPETGDQTNQPEEPDPAPDTGDQSDPPDDPDPAPGGNDQTTLPDDESDPVSEPGDSDGGEDSEVEGDETTPPAGADEV